MTYLGGIGGGMLANFLWGVSPLYYGKLGAINPVVLLCTQVILTFLVLSCAQGFRVADMSIKNLVRFAPTSILIGMNWAAYVAAVMYGMPLQASVAYLMAPMLTLILGSFLFSEPMSKQQKIGVAVSTAAVLLDVILTREVPYLGILIAIPFAGYIILHKKGGGKNPLKALQSETLLLTPLAILVLLSYAPSAGGTPTGSNTPWLLGLIGFVNAVPLALFIYAAPRMSPSQLSACQFIAPITSAIVSSLAFDYEIGLPKLLVLTLLAVGMAFAIAPQRLPAT